MPTHACGQQPPVPSQEFLSSHLSALSVCQINNYLTVPAHKLDSPTMSRARIGSGKAGPGCPVRGPAAGRSGPHRASGEDRLSFTDLPSLELLLHPVEVGVALLPSPGTGVLHLG